MPTDNSTPPNGAAPAAGHVDGNALAGPLGELLNADVTSMTSQCAHCGRSGAFAELRVYAHAPGWVARCPGCDGVVLKLVRSAGRVWLELAGTARWNLTLS
ncbi:DUF6510 family protein [Actinomadura parmotrematis]|uniref:Hydrogenase maturation nickel metallochaperone HypA n=1 Tax=Actinomadura parmotrematis TaxID=2864039 RepID=A0ABS7G2E0_9ACTN|nr:DUF6510 family protein [Actinomadura parmotrematis]MBW8486891.1 hypothetical protein [Actinomadura parmotrematis]